MNEDRARDALEHLQTAALEMIAAARAALDVAEELVRDPAAAAAVVFAAAQHTPPSERHSEGSFTRVNVG